MSLWTLASAAATVYQIFAMAVRRHQAAVRSAHWQPYRLHLQYDGTTNCRHRQRGMIIPWRTLP
jgi:hypothetical protein